MDYRRRAEHQQQRNDQPENAAHAVGHVMGRSGLMGGADGQGGTGLPIIQHPSGKGLPPQRPAPAVRSRSGDLARFVLNWFRCCWQDLPTAALMIHRKGARLS